MEIKETIKKIEENMNNELPLIKNISQLNDIRIKYLGKKGLVQEMLDHIRDLSVEEKKEVGMLVNNLKERLNDTINNLKEELEKEEINKKLVSEKIDITLPGTKVSVGGIHPLTEIIEEIEEVFISMGYDVVEGPEVESDLYNFEMLNLPKGHPARDAQDSFYITEEMLLRTHTSPVQVRTMLANKEKTPIRIICPGKTYRRDNDDATHSHQFMQVEGLIVDKDISMAHLKGTLEIVVKRLFGEDREIRFRPGYFPFTEPSIEVDINCFKCNGKGCNICKDTGYIEVLGAGMVHPNVLRMSGYDPNVYTGFAFGIGVERIAMFKYGIPDIRYFYTNDLRFLSQFNRVEGGEE
jgi:phenylalanyl-tRNA synthetase alpha chain